MEDYFGCTMLSLMALVFIFSAYISLSNSNGVSWVLLGISTIMAGFMLWALAIVLRSCRGYDLTFENHRILVSYSNGREDAFQLPEDIHELEIIGDRLHVVMRNQDGAAFVFCPHCLTDGDSALREYNNVVEQVAAFDS